jgi:hypothetical protein
MVPIARLETELRATGFGQMLIGLGGLVASFAVSDSPARLLVPFLVALVIVGLLSARASAWLRTADLTRASDAPVEPTSQTIRRCSLSLVVALAAVVVAVVIAGGLGAILAGVVTATGIVDLRNMAWVRAREAHGHPPLYRQLGKSPFSPGRRPIYTRPTNDSTLLT